MTLKWIRKLQLKRLVSRPSMLWVGGLSLVLCAPIVALLVLITLANADFFSAEVEHTLLADKDLNTGLVVSVRIISFSESTNTAQIAVGVVATKNAAELIGKSSASYKVTAYSGDNSWGPTNIATVTMDRNSRTYDSSRFEAESSPGNLIMFRDVDPYPFDGYASTIGINVERKDNLPATNAYSDFRYSTNVVKMVAGRRLIVGGYPNLLDVRLERPTVQKAFVAISSAIFTLILAGVSIMLIRVPSSQSPQGLLLTLASLILGSVGFRDLIGLSHLSSFGTGDALVIGVPLILLSLAFLRVAHFNRRHKDLTPTAANQITNQGNRKID